MQCQPLRNAVVQSLFLKDVNEQCQKLCNKSDKNSSVLLTPHNKHNVINLKGNIILLLIKENY